MAARPDEAGRGQGGLADPGGDIQHPVAGLDLPETTVTV